MDKFIPKMSYSSACTLRKCERKYWLAKVAKVPIDSDASVDTEAFAYGKAYHEILELTKHRRPKDLKPFAVDAGKKHGLDREGIFKIYAMSEKYYSCREQTELKEHSSEVSVQTDEFIMFIDSILVDESNGEWWILDNKTSTRIGVLLKARVHRDYQLNFYASFADDLAIALKLDRSRFAGVRYGICARPNSKPKKTETLKEYSSRVKVQYEEFVVPARDLVPDVAREFVKDARSKQLALFEVTRIEDTRPNFLACEDYFKPCEFWSRCYGHTVTSPAKIPVAVFSPEPSPEEPEDETPDF